MIAPVVHEHQTSRNVYFPDAVWYNYAGQVKSLQICITNDCKCNSV